MVKTFPAPKLEAWVDPKLFPKESVLETIAKRLQDQFESLAPAHARVKFKTYPDVYSEEFKKTLIGLRKYSKVDRCLVYYNGHGVPRPTQTGELWVFNKAYTQYIPISVADILTWVGPPAVLIWDCNNAGHIVNAVIQAAAKKDEDLAAELELLRLQASTGASSSTEWPRASTTLPRGHATTASTNLPEPPAGSGHTSPSTGKVPTPHTMPRHPTARYSDTIQLAACQANQLLPLDPDVPADIFTSCLSSPVEMGLRFYVLRNNARGASWTSTAEFFADLDKLEKMPGQMEMRRTPLGELTWIFTSIADAIAWNHLDRQLFTRIFRGDLVLAATFRGFLLAERVMRAHGCTPISVPKLPPTHQSELWKYWDLEVDMCLSQLPAIWRSEAVRAEYDQGKTPRSANSLPPQVLPYKPSSFFSQQLTAFELWLKEIVTHNPEENGERDEDVIAKQQTMLRWSCNDWPSVRMDKIEVTDFASAHPAPTMSGSSSGGAGAKHKPYTNHHAHSSPSFAHPHHGPSPMNEQPRTRPIRYRLPTYIKHFPLNSRPGDDLYPPSPPQLPIVLQVLLSQLHRLRALILLCRFMDLGPWAVHLSLSIGIFQYVLKLLQAPAAELRPVLIFIWARILTVYPEGRIELFRPGPGRPHAPPDAAPVEYFVRLLAPHTPELLPVANVVDHKAMCAFILSIGCKNLPAHATRLLQLGVPEIVVHRLPELVAAQRQWYLILLAHIWEQSGAAKGRAIRMGVNTLLSEMLTDKAPEVRTAALYAFGTLLGVSTDPAGVGEVEDELCPYSELRDPDSLCLRDPSGLQTNKLHSLSASNPAITRLGYEEQLTIEVGSAMACCHCAGDGSPMFRHQLVVLLSALVDQHLGHFIVAAFEASRTIEDERVMRTVDLIRKYRNEEDGRRMGGETAEEWEDRNAQQPMTDRATKLERLMAKLQADELGRESVRPYLWMEYSSIYTVLLDLTLDAADEVAEAARKVVDYLHARLASSVLGMRLGLDELTGEDNDGEDEEAEHGDGSRAWASPDQGDRKEAVAQRPLGGTMFQSLSTVNQLVPNFVKVSASGWKTPFGRSPETTDGPSMQQTRTRTGTEEDVEPVDPLSVAAWERRKRLGSSEEPIERIIARTRLADEYRRQLQRNYGLVLVPLGPLEMGEAGDDYLIYLGLHDQGELRQEGRVLPLRSTYYDLSAHVFLKPRMAGKESEDDRCGSLAQTKALWRKTRNERMIIESQPLRADAGTCVFVFVCLCLFVFVCVCDVC